VSPDDAAALRKLADRVWSVAESLLKHSGNESRRELKAVASALHDLASLDALTCSERPR
jgi:hypothetical protein